MSITDIISIVFLAVFTAACLIVAVVFGAWWHVGTGAMTSLVAWAIYSEDSEESNNN